MSRLHRAIPHFRQPKSKPYCGPVCAKMILASYGKQISLKKIASAIPMTRHGVDIAALGTYFLQQDFSAILFLYPPGFPNRFINLHTAETPSEILRWCHRYPRCKKQHVGVYIDRYRKSLPEFLQRGGIVIPKPISVKEIRLALRKNMHCILNLNVAALYGLRRRKYAGHYVVPTNVTHTSMTVHDPNHDQSLTYPVEYLLHACYTWSGGALFVSPKKS